MVKVARPQKRPRSEDEEQKGGIAIQIPTFEIKSSETVDPKLFAEAFETFQAVHLPKFSQQQHADFLTWKDLGGLYRKLEKDDKESWCIETAGAVQKPNWEDFLKPEITDDVAYCSFLVQKDKDSFSDSLQKLPLKSFSWNAWDYEPCLWIFFGRNSSENDLQGRPEHTDSISHDGTWHYQLSGTKRWFLRPTLKLLEQMEERLEPDVFSSWKESTKIQIDCHDGDVIVVNTRLWNHQTIIPPQKEPSVSYARDFWVNQKGIQEKVYMTNLDGLYSTNDIECGTIIFKETNMPDCELHRSSTNPNCEVVELEDGTSAVVSSRPIAAGEFFCVPESSDEEEEEEDDDDDDDEDTGSFEEVESE